MFQMLRARSRLVHQASITCGLCLRRGIRDGSQHVLPLDDLRTFMLRTGAAMAHSSEGRRIIVRAARAHYAAEHPEVVLVLR